MGLRRLNHLSNLLYQIIPPYIQKQKNFYSNDLERKCNKQQVLNVVLHNLLLFLWERLCYWMIHFVESQRMAQWKTFGNIHIWKAAGKDFPPPHILSMWICKMGGCLPPPQPCAPGASKQDPSVLPQEMKQLNGFKMAALENTCIISFLKKNVCNDIAVKTYLSGIRETAHAMLRYEA